MRSQRCCSRGLSTPVFVALPIDSAILACFLIAILLGLLQGFASLIIPCGENTTKMLSQGIISICGVEDLVPFVYMLVHGDDAHNGDGAGMRSLQMP